jgi:hypothetical protein
MAGSQVVETYTSRCALLSREAAQPCALTARVEEGGGIEPLALRLPWFSGPVASHLAAPSVLVRRVGFEPTLYCF